MHGTAMFGATLVRAHIVSVGVTLPHKVEGEVSGLVSWPGIASKLLQTTKCVERDWILLIAFQNAVLVAVAAQRDWKGDRHTSFLAAVPFVFYPCCGLVLQSRTGHTYFARIGM